MAHIVGTPRPDVGFSRDVDGGPAWLIDYRHSEWSELSSELSAVLEVDEHRRARALALVLKAGVVRASELAEDELRVQLTEGQNASDTDKRALLETLAQLAIEEWLEQQSGVHS